MNLLPDTNKTRNLRFPHETGIIERREKGAEIHHR